MSAPAFRKFVTSWASRFAGDETPLTNKDRETIPAILSARVREHVRSQGKLPSRELVFNMAVALACERLHKPAPPYFGRDPNAVDLGQYGEGLGRGDFPTAELQQAVEELAHQMGADVGSLELSTALPKAMLQGDDLAHFLPQMYGNQPARWDEALQGVDRWRCVVNALTRLRFCTADGTMEFDSKEGAQGAPEGFMPWFNVPDRCTAADVVAFGHWSTLGWLGRTDVWALDSGCVWGGCLSALALDLAHQQHTLIQVQCEQAQTPG